MGIAQSRFSQFAVVGILFGIALLFFLVTQRDQSFPPLPAGKYRGQATFLGGSEQPVTIYVERRTGSDKLLFVVFADQWKPQATPLIALSGDDEDREGPYEPLSLRGPKGFFTLYGTEVGGVYNGYIVTADNKRGAWALEQLPADAFDLDQKSLGTSPDDLGDWLNLKGRYRSLKRRVAELDQAATDRKERYERLLSFVKEGTALKDRAASRQVALKKEVEDARAEREQVNLQINALVNDLSVQRRVSKKGRAVESARRVANRENKWYLANWRAEEDRAGLGQYVDESIQVDFKKLDTAYAKANEILSLARERAMEQVKIQQLEQALRSGSSPTRPADQLEPPDRGNSLPPANRQEQNSWWDRVFG